MLTVYTVARPSKSTSSTCTSGARPRARRGEIARQTTDTMDFFDDLPAVSTIKFVAVAESDIFSFIITAFILEGRIDAHQDLPLWAAESCSWRRRLVPGDLGVAGGDLKEHFYTDAPESELNLWPETVCRILVERMTSPEGGALKPKWFSITRTAWL